MLGMEMMQGTFLVRIAVDHQPPVAPLVQARPEEGFPRFPVNAITPVEVKDSAGMLAEEGPGRQHVAGLELGGREGVESGGIHG